jgi:cytidylate kinase
LFKVIFLAGGPGSGKDFIMKEITSGFGLTEVNSDNMFEYLMRYDGLDFKMPDHEEDHRNALRSRAKGISSRHRNLLVDGRRGLIINSTGGNFEKTVSIKKKLEYF